MTDQRRLLVDLTDGKDAMIQQFAQATENFADGATGEAIAVYAHALRCGGVIVGDPQLPAALGLAPAVIEASLTQLVELHLLREQDDGDWRRLIPVSPEAAAASLISPIGEQIHRQRAAISEIQGRLNMFQPHYEDNRVLGSGCADVESLCDETELYGRLHLAAQRCHGQFVGFQAEAKFPLEQVVAMSMRGVQVRLLLPHRLRADLRARTLLRAVTGSGGEVRTVGRPPRQLMIFDDEAAFLLDGQAANGSAGVVIHHQETVRLLGDVVESTWAAAQPYSAGEIGYHEVADDLRRTVIELLASGLTDEVIARRLGVSVRTCRRHIAMVLSGLHAVSRFQAGALATAAGLVEPRQFRRDWAAVATSGPPTRNAMVASRPAPVS